MKKMKYFLPEKINILFKVFSFLKHFYIEYVEQSTSNINTEEVLFLWLSSCI